MKSHRKRLLTALTAVLALGASSQAQVASPPGNPGDQSTLPSAQRRSTVHLAFDAPRQARELVIAHTLLAGTTFVPGSSRLNGQVLPDPQRGPSGTLYWTLPVQALMPQATDPAEPDSAAYRGTLTYTLTHTQALPELPTATLLVRYAGDRAEILKGQLDENDLRAARALSQPAPETENAGAIKQPLAGSEIRLRERINVIVEVPLQQPPNLTVNGHVISADQIGETTDDGPRGVTRVTYVGVPLQLGPNTLQVGQDTIQVQRIGGTQRIEIVPVTLIADGSTPVQLKFRALDSFGKLTAQTMLSLRSNLEPRTPDASPGDADYQLRLENGEGILELQPQATPTTLKLSVQQGEDIQTYTFDVMPDQQRVAVGVISATLGLNGDFSLQDDLTWQARANYEGPLAGGKLYIATDKDGLPTDRDTLKRFAVYGDSSVENIPLQGIDPVAMRYDHPTFRVQYSRDTMPIDVLPIGEQLTALAGYSKTNPQVSAFAAYVPADRITGERIKPTGTRVLHLTHGGISAGSETLEVVTLERFPGTTTLTGKELKRVTLIRNVDYQLDLRTGVVTLARALDHLDQNLNEIIVLAAYRLDNPLGQRNLAYGAQIKYTGPHATAGVAVVNLDGVTTYGARATYTTDQLQADALVAYAGGVQASADLTAQLGDDTLQARARYRDASYHGLAPFGVGFSANASYEAHLNDHLGANVQAEYQRTPSAVGGSVSGRLEGQWEPFSVGAGLKYAFGQEYGLGGVFSVGYHHQPVSVDIVHTQPVSGNLAATTNLSAKYTLTEQVTLGVSDLINWKTGHTAALTLDSRLGNTNYQLAYDLPNSGGQGNRARFGVTTSLNLSQNLTAGLHGSALYSLAAHEAELTAGGDLRYKTEDFVLTSGSDLTYNTNTGFGVVLRAGATGQLNKNFSLSADGLAEFGAGKSGQRFAVGYAYRSRNFNSLGTARYVNGTLAANKGEFTTNLSAEYRHYSALHWALRGNLDTRTLLNDPGSFAWQAGLNGQVYLTKDFGLGAWGHMITTPSSQNTLYGFGLEGSLRLLPGTWLSLGYNPLGFTGIGNAYTKQGAYLRIDLTFDEMLGGEQ